MTVYRVELRGDVRELYVVIADSPEDARRRWQEGDLYLSEASSMEVYAVEEDQ